MHKVRGVQYVAHDLNRLSLIKKKKDEGRIVLVFKVVDI